MNVLLRITVFSCLVLICANARASSAPCALDDLQSCKTCTQIEKVVDLSNPDRGEYYRGAFWNGLFAAYRFDCRALGKSLLDHKANPNLGGASGSFPATLVQAWPHTRSAVNEAWVVLIDKYPVDLEWKNPWTSESASEIVSRHEVNVDYPNLWESLRNRK